MRKLILLTVLIATACLAAPQNKNIPIYVPDAVAMPSMMMVATSGGSSEGKTTVTETFSFGSDTDSIGTSENWNVTVGALVIANHASDGGVSNTAVVQETAAAWTGAGSFANDQYAQIVVDAVSTGDYIGVGVRMSTSVADYYSFYCRNGDCYLVFWDADGSPDTFPLGFDDDVTLAQNDVLSMTVTGQDAAINIVCKKNSDTIFDWTNSGGSYTLNSGVPGITGYY